MARTNIDVDEKACAKVMRRYQFATKRETANFALKAVVSEPLSLMQAKNLRGSGWDGDLDEIRNSKSVGLWLTRRCMPYGLFRLLTGRCRTKADDPRNTYYVRGLSMDMLHI